MAPLTSKQFKKDLAKSPKELSRSWKLLTGKQIKVPAVFEVRITLRAAPDTWIAVIRRKPTEPKKPKPRRR